LIQTNVTEKSERENAGMRECGNVEMWECENVKMWECGNALPVVAKAKEWIRILGY
jgi:hypothetical protein